MSPSAPALLAPDEEQICPLCINELDETEKAWLPCSCGYQLCLFCYDRLKTEFSNRCPNCRVEYDSDFQAGLRRRQERVAQLQREAAEARAAAKAAAAAAAAERASAGSKLAAAPPPPPPRAAARTPRSPRSPRRNLHIEEEQLWPSLGAAAHAAQPHNGHAHHGGSQQQQQQQQQQPLHGGAARQPPQPGEAGGRRPLPPLPLLPPILPSAPAEQEASSSSGSADTAATTPQSPVSSVVAFRAAPAAAVAPAAVAGRCAVVLQRGGTMLAEPDPEGASLAASLQEAVRAGSLSVKQAAASLASYLRQRQQMAAAAAIGSASSSPGHGSRQPSSAGSCGAPGGSGLLGYSPFAQLGGSAGLLGGEASLASCASGHSMATSVSLSHWASSAASPSGSSLSLQGSQLPAADQEEHVPLYLRRGTLPAAGRPGAIGAGSGGAAQPEGKRVLRPPPGFGGPLPNGVRA